MYVNGYVLCVPEENKEAYVRLAKIFAEVAMDFGALELFENWELDVPDGEQTDYRRAVKALPGEKIVFSWIVWPDKKTETTAHKSMMEDSRLKGLTEMPFDGKRMIMGNFEPIISHHKD